MEGMNKPLKTSRRHTHLTLGDLILAVSSASHSNRETAAAVTDLLRSGRVSLAAQRNCKVRIVA